MIAAPLRASPEEPLKIVRGSLERRVLRRVEKEKIAKDPRGTRTLKGCFVMSNGACVCGQLETRMSELLMFILSLGPSNCLQIMLHGIIGTLPYTWGRGARFTLIKTIVCTGTW